ncbi:MAG: hypothetical protein ACK4OM_00115 [Alphaproteobacteria bacterium]
MTKRVENNHPELNQFFNYEVLLYTGIYLKMNEHFENIKFYTDASINISVISVIYNYFNKVPLLSTIVGGALAIYDSYYLLNSLTEKIVIDSNLTNEEISKDSNFLENIKEIHNSSKINIQDFKDKIENGELKFEASKNLHLNTNVKHDYGIMDNAYNTVYEYITGDKIAPKIITTYDRDLTFDSFVNLDGEVIMIGTDEYNHSIMNLIG